MYRPPGSCTTPFLEDFLALSGFLSSTGSSFIICGDINVHLDIECGDRSRFNDILQCCGLVQSVSGPTHLLGHTLDVLISPCDSDFVRNVSVGDFISDHAAIRCQLDFSHPSTSIDKWVSYRRYHRIDIDQFRNDLNNIPFVRSPEGTAAELYDQYITGVTQVLDKHAPIISRKAKQQSDEWLSDSYRMARSLRQQFERRWRKHKSELNRSRLRRQIAWCNRLANKDKGSYYTNLITAYSRDPKKLWQSLRKVLHRTSETVLPAHSSDKSLTDMFASFFSNKISKIRDTFASSGSFNDAPDSVPPAFNAFMPVTEDEVYKSISESPTKSCSLDPIPTFLLKDCLDILLSSITKLVNYSLIEGSFPNSFKKAVVTPLIKKASLPRDDLKNYRPVSGLCFLSKLVEWVVARQLTSHIKNNKLDNPHQSAYKPGHSTETALLSIKNEVHLSLARGEPTALVLLDLSAAFDTIDHNILLGYLKSWFGLGGTALRWFASYLRNRCQAIKIGSTLSELSNLIYGVPQGSVLGPSLFSLYTTPLSKIIRLHPHIKFHFYADDTQLYIHLSHKNASSALAKLNACLRDVQEWMSLSKLKLNPEKTEFIVFGSKAQRQKISSHFPVSILGSLLHPVDSVRNLGVWFDADFSFSEHIKRTCKACFLQMRDLRRIRKYLTSEVAVLAANALVSSRLDYCNSLFRGLSGFNQHKLQSIQNTLARIVTNHRKYAHVTPILQKLHWLPVKYRCIFKTATLVYKFLHSGSPSYFEPFLSFSSCPYSTRHSHPDRQYLTVPPFHSSVFKSAKHFGHSFAFDAPNIWNDLPQDVRSATSVASFRKKLKTYLFAKAYPP